MDNSPAFIGNFEFEGPESPLSLTIWQGDKTYQFSTNFIGVYPNVPFSLSEAKKKSINPIREKQEKLEEIIEKQNLKRVKTFDVRQGEFCSEITDNGIVQFFMDKRDFSKLDEKLRQEFVACYKPNLMWDLDYLRKIEFEPWLLEVLKEKNELDKAFKNLYNHMSRINKKNMEESWKLTKSFVKSNYNKDNFEEEIITLFFEKIGYEFKEKKSLRKTIQLFKKTDYFSEFSEIFFDNCERTFGERGISEVTSTTYDYVEKSKQEQLLDRLKELLGGRTELLGKEEYDKFIKYQLEELFALIQDYNLESRTCKDLNKIISDKLEDSSIYNEKIFSLLDKVRNKKERLEDKIKNIKKTNTLSYDFAKQRMLLFLDIMHRDTQTEHKKKIYFDGIKLKEMLSTNELLRTPFAIFDIEKFQYGSIKEIITMCGTIIKDALGELYGQLDTIRTLPVKDIEKIFKVKKHYFTKDLSKSIADFINNHKAFIHATYGSYDWIHLKASGVFKLGQARKVLPRKRVHEKFIERYEPTGPALDLLKLMMIIRPHFLNHRLETSINHLYERAGVIKMFEKIFQHRGLTDSDRIAEKTDSRDPEIREKALEEAYKLGVYTTSDVGDLMEALLHKNNRDIFEDLLDVCKTFNVTLDQACSNANTVTNLLDKRYYERYGGVLSPGFYRKDFLDIYKEFRTKYTSYKTKKLIDQGLQIDFDKGIKENISQLYFSPEMFIAQVLYNRYPSLKGYIERTMSIENDLERQAGRLQYVRAFVVNMLTELYDIHKREDEIENLREKQDKLSEKGKVMPDGDKKEKARKEYSRRAKSIFNKEDSLGKKKWFFERLFSVSHDTVERKIQEAYKKVADVINENDIHPLQIKGNFIYAQENLSDEVLEDAGLFRVDKDLTILNMGKNELTYYSLGQYAGYPSRWEHPTYHYNQFQLRILKNVLDSVFKGDYMDALGSINSAANKIKNLESILTNRKLKKNKEFIQDLLTFNRDKDVYEGVTGYKEYYVMEKGKKKKKVEITKEEFTDDTRHEFVPDLSYYTTKFMKKFFGLNGEEIDVNATLTKIIGGIINTGKNNLAKTKKQYGQIREMLNRVVAGYYCDDEYLEKLVEIGQRKQVQLFPA